MATTTAALFASWNGSLLIPAATRLQGIFFWDLIVYLLEGIVFLVTGLQIRTLLDRTGMIGLQDSTLAVLLTVVWLLLHDLFGFVRRDPVSPWNRLFILAVVEVRGVVSLAAALAIPLTALNGTLFPYRDLVLFVAFGVVATLVVQGLLLPRLFIAWVGESRH